MCLVFFWFLAFLGVFFLFMSGLSAVLDSEALHLALDMVSGGLTKGSVWINGFMIGRYWNVLAAGQCNDETDCLTQNYAGAYHPDRCRTGCGAASQQFYKIPTDILHT
jgi:hypothetical protein